MLASVIGLIFALLLGEFKPPSPLEVLGKLDGNLLPEASGIVKSRRFDGVFWIHNDSGNRPLLFAIRRDGKIVRQYGVDVPNIDWEDIAIDDEGHLYLGDIGNNGAHLPIRTIYQIAEPDPSKPGDGPLKAIKSTTYTFPRGGRFDSESLYMDRGRAILVAKTFDQREAELYSVPFDRPGSLFKPALAERIGTLRHFTEPATGADLSADGVWLAVCSSRATRVYQRQKDKRWELFAEVDYPHCAMEAICWDGLDLILAGEDRRIDRLPQAVWRKGLQLKAKDRAAAAF